MTSPRFRNHKSNREQEIIDAVQLINKEIKEPTTNMDFELYEEGRCIELYNGAVRII